MCLSCGCDIVYDDHGNYGTITIQDIYNAAKVSGISPDDVINNIENSYGREFDHEFTDIDDDDDDDDDDIGGN
jgi:hypothetical protein